MRSLPGYEIIELNVLVDHIHMVIVIPPKCTVSAVIGQMKQFTASRLGEKFGWLGKVYWKGVSSIQSKFSLSSITYIRSIWKGMG